MKAQRKTYTREFKLEAIRLYERIQKSATQIEADLELPAGKIHKWRQCFKGQSQAAFVGKGLQSELRQRLSGCAGWWVGPWLSGCARIWSKMCCAWLWLNVIQAAIYCIALTKAVNTPATIIWFCSLNTALRP